jgi:iron complex transport system substrate-binding protein
MGRSIGAFRWVLALLLSSFLLAGPAVAAGKPAAWLTVTDDLGRKIVLLHPVTRIVSLEPSVTEILFAVGAGNLVVGDTIYCDYPPEAKRVPHIGNVLDPNIEKIIALKPDVVIDSSETMQVAEADQLSRRCHAPLFVTAARSYSDVMRDVQKLGALAGNPRHTEATVDQMQDALAAVRKAVRGRPRPKVFVVTWEKPLMTATGRSYIGDLVRLAGGENIAEREPGLPYPVYSEEKLVTADPDFILATGESDKVQQATLPSLSRLALRAVRNGHAYSVPDDWTSRPGPRLGLGLIAIAQLLHPEAFKSKR